MHDTLERVQRVKIFSIAGVDFCLGIGGPFRAVRAGLNLRRDVLIESGIGQQASADYMLILARDIHGKRWHTRRGNARKQRKPCGSYILQLGKLFAGQLRVVIVMVVGDERVVAGDSGSIVLLYILINTPAPINGGSGLRLAGIAGDLLLKKLRGGLCISQAIGQPCGMPMASRRLWLRGKIVDQRGVILNGRGQIIGHHRHVACGEQCLRRPFALRKTLLHLLQQALNLTHVRSVASRFDHQI